MTKHPTRNKILAVSFAAVALAVACDDGSTTGSPDEPFAALVVTTDFQSGAYSTISLPDLAPTPNVQVIHDDASCRFDPITGLPFIVARLGADAVDVVDPEAGWQVMKEYSVEAGSNAQDIAVVSEERAYVARFAKPDLLIVHPTTGAEIGHVDLSAYADADGLPEAAWLYPVDGEVFVLLQRLDKLAPTDYSSVLVLDGAEGTVKDDVRLAATNPTGKLRYSEAVGRLIIIETGVFGALDGGIEYLNPEDHALSGLVITEEELGGDVADAAIVSETKGYAVIVVFDGGKASTHVVVFDPSRGKKLKDLLVSDEWAYPAVELTPDGTELWVADRTGDAPGIRIFSTADDVELTKKPIDVGLPPSMICFVE
ncbi:MAG: hypothetical protein PHU25_19765 [Deltaproteobacteria bacterium]|nr:hypothetical protein [Deltaproteobacteria bacterium]